MAVYEVTCVKKEACSGDEHAFHVTEIEIDGSDGHRRIDVHVARLLLSADDILTVGPAAAPTAEVRKGRCGCGEKTLRTRRSDDGGNGLAALPDCV